jgi:biuret amidohydrolase
VSTAVVALHYQNDVIHPDGKIHAGVGDPALIGNARKLLRGARRAGVPVVSVGIVFRPGHRGVVTNSPMFEAAVRSSALVEGSWGAEFHEQLKPRRGELVVRHSRINAFYGSDLELVLGSLGTHSTVEHTARHAADIGYEVVVAADACTAADPELHTAGLRALALHVSRVATVDEILGGWDG